MRGSSWYSTQTTFSQIFSQIWLFRDIFASFREFEAILKSSKNKPIVEWQVG